MHFVFSMQRRTEAPKQAPSMPMVRSEALKQAPSTLMERIEALEGQMVRDGKSEVQRAQDQVGRLLERIDRVGPHVVMPVLEGLVEAAIAEGHEDRDWWKRGLVEARKMEGGPGFRHLVVQWYGSDIDRRVETTLAGVQRAIKAHDKSPRRSDSPPRSNIPTPSAPATPPAPVVQYPPMGYASPLAHSPVVHPPAHYFGHGAAQGYGAQGYGANMYPGQGYGGQRRGKGAPKRGSRGGGGCFGCGDTSHKLSDCAAFKKMKDS